MSSSKTAPTDAISLLKQDHREVEQLFQKFEEARSAGPKEKIAAQICMMLRIHAAIEEEIFYPAARDEAKKKDPLNEMLDEAQVEHNAAKELIAEIEAGDPKEDLWQAKVKVLGEQIQHHVKEEESELFREVRDTELDLKELGAQMIARKEELMAQGAVGS